MNYLIDIIKNLSIKQKLIMLSMSTSIIAVIVTCGGLITFSIVEDRKEMVDEMLLVGKILGEELSTALVYKQKNLMQESLSTLRARESIVQACVYTRNGKTFSSYVRDEIVTECEMIPRINRRYEFFSDHVYEHHLITAADIKFEGINRGSIYIISSLSRINDKVKRYIFNAIVLSIFIIVVSYLISKALQKHISNGIIRLADISYIVKAGNYGVRATRRSNDEIGELTDAFNNMLNEIQHAKENLEENVKERTAELEEALKIKAEFLSNMSHEIRTPIHGIMNYADFLVKDWKQLPDEQKFNFINKLYINSDRLLSLINNLLDLSKLDANKLEFAIEKSDLASITKSVIHECEPLYMGKKSLTLSFEPGEDVNTVAYFDIERMRQVIRNLASNAIKFTESGKIIISIKEVKFKKANGSRVKGLKFTITDDGIGVPEDELESIFDQFNQSAATRTGAGGTGLGLAIASEIVKAHHGKIWAENNKAQGGATFIFIIPVKQALLGATAIKKRKGY
jgi:signal transduction histidine kinase